MIQTTSDDFERYHNRLRDVRDSRAGLVLKGPYRLSPLGQRTSEA